MSSQTKRQFICRVHISTITDSSAKDDMCEAGGEYLPRCKIARKKIGTKLCEVFFLHFRILRGEPRSRRPCRRPGLCFYSIVELRRCQRWPRERKVSEGASAKFSLNSLPWWISPLRYWASISPNLSEEKFCLKLKGVRGLIPCWPFPTHRWGTWLASNSLNPGDFYNTNVRNLVGKNSLNPGDLADKSLHYTEAIELGGCRTSGRCCD